MDNIPSYDSGATVLHLHARALKTGNGWSFLAVRYLNTAVFLP
jgi:hypothetical protein